MDSSLKRIIKFNTLNVYAKNDLIKYRGSLIQRIIVTLNILTSIYIYIYINLYMYIDFQIRFKFYQL